MRVLKFLYISTDAFSKRIGFDGFVVLSIFKKMDMKDLVQRLKKTLRGKEMRKYITNDFVQETKIFCIGDTIFPFNFKYRVSQTNPNLNTSKRIVRRCLLDFFVLNQMKSLAYIIINSVNARRNSVNKIVVFTENLKYFIKILTQMSQTRGY